MVDRKTREDSGQHDLPLPVLMEQDPDWFAMPSLDLWEEIKRHQQAEKRILAVLEGRLNATEMLLTEDLSVTEIAIETTHSSRKAK